MISVKIIQFDSFGCFRFLVRYSLQFFILYITKGFLGCFQLCIVFSIVFFIMFSIVFSIVFFIMFSIVFSIVFFIVFSIVFFIMFFIVFSIVFSVVFFIKLRLDSARGVAFSPKLIILLEGQRSGSSTLYITVFSKAM